MLMGGVVGVRGSVRIRAREVGVHVRGSRGIVHGQRGHGELTPRSKWKGFILNLLDARGLCQLVRQHACWFAIHCQKRPTLQPQHPRPQVGSSRSNTE